MKIDDHLIVLNGQAASGTGPRRPQKTKNPNHSGVILLISQENQRAWRLNPRSLTEAKRLLGQVQSQLSKLPDETLAEIHRLDDRCLIRLP